jgi:transcriptional regulator with XRE-family HTH domain
MAGKNEDSATKAEDVRRKLALDHFAALAKVKRSGAWLRQWRADHSVTQEILAEALNVSLRTVIRYEQLEELPRLLVIAIERLSKRRLAEEPKVIRNEQEAGYGDRRKELARIELTISVTASREDNNKLFLKNLSGVID